MFVDLLPGCKHHGQPCPVLLSASRLRLRHHSPASAGQVLPAAAGRSAGGQRYQSSASLCACCVRQMGEGRGGVGRSGGGGGGA